MLEDDTSQTERLAYRVNEVAELLGLSRSSIYVLFNTGELPFVKVAGRRLVRRSDLLKLIQEGQGD